MSRVDFDDSAFQQGFRRTMARLEDNVAAELARTGNEVAQIASAAAPTRTGHLKRSIKAVPGRDERGAYVDVEVRDFKGHFWEFGTSRHGARPFLRPALEQVGRILQSKRIGR